jgi:hypothetical protein
VGVAETQPNLPLAGVRRKNVIVLKKRPATGCEAEAVTMGRDDAWWQDSCRKAAHRLIACSMTCVDIEGITLRVLKASILVAMGIVIGVAASAGNPVTLSADVTASLFDKAASPPGTDQSAPIIQCAVAQSTAGAEALPPTVKNAPNQTRTENSGSSSAEQDTRALAKVRDAPAPVVKNVPARSVQKQRARAQNQSVQNAEEPSFLQSLLSRFEASPAQRGP